MEKSTGGETLKLYHYGITCRFVVFNMILAVRLTLASSQCVDSLNRVVATYRCSNMALNKDGELNILPVSSYSISLSQCILKPYTNARTSQSGLFMADLLVATSLALRA